MREPIELLHILGTAPEGAWGIFSLTEENGDTTMISVVIPQTLWQAAIRRHPFSSEVALMELYGERAITRVLDREDTYRGTIVVTPDDVSDVKWQSAKWDATLRVCAQCRQAVPRGEVLEGIANALPPDPQGFVEILVLCPDCQVQTPHRLAVWGLLTR